MIARNHASAARQLYEAYRTHDFESVADVFASDAVLTAVPTGDVYRGGEGYLRFARAWAAALPDLRLEIERIEVAGETVVVAYTLRGTHTGALIGNSGFIPPTWAVLELRACDVLRFEDGRIVELDSYFDSATMLRQMGLLPHSPLHAADRRAALDLYVTPVDTSAEQRNKAIVHRFLEEVVNQNNPAAAVVVCTGDFVLHGGTLGEARDLADFQSLLASLFTSFPDLNVEVHDVIAEQDRVVTRVTMRGTQLGDFQGIPPTGKCIRSAATVTYRIAEGRIAEEWWQSDMLGLLRQIDAMPEAAASP